MFLYLICCFTVDKVSNWKASNSRVNRSEAKLTESSLEQQERVWIIFGDVYLSK